MSGWNAVVTGELGQAAIDIATDVATKMAQPQDVERIGERAYRQSRNSDIFEWSAIAFPYENAVNAILFGQMDSCFPNHDWDHVAHVHLASAVRSLESHPSLGRSPSLFGGLAGLCFAVRSIAQHGKRYPKLQATLDGMLERNLILSEAYSIEHGQHAFSLGPSGVRARDYDLIHGAVGLGAYLLQAPLTPAFTRLLESLVDKLIALSNQEPAASGYFIPPEKQESERHLARCPDGCIDLGIAHGVPGPMAFMALASLAGVQQPGQLEVIAVLSTWIADQRRQDSWGTCWPTEVMPSGMTLASSRASWCYGSPGISTALWLSGEALEDKRLQTLAVEAIRDASHRPRDAREIPSPIVCHGIAGLLQVVLRFVHRTGDKELTAFAHDLTADLVALYDPNSPVGYCDIEPDGRRADKPGFLEGASGIALVLLAATTDVDPEWDRMLLLS